MYVFVYFFIACAIAKVEIFHNLVHFLVCLQPLEMFLLWLNQVYLKLGLRVFLKKYFEEEGLLTQSK
jgi:hypothetical protein